MINDKVVTLPFGNDTGKKFIIKAMGAWAEYKLATFIMSAISRGSRETGNEYQSAVSLASVVDFVKNTSFVSPDAEDMLETMTMRVLGLISQDDQNAIVNTLYGNIKFINDEGIEIAFFSEAHITDPRNHFFLIAESIKARIAFYQGVGG